MANRITGTGARAGTASVARGIGGRLKRHSLLTSTALVAAAVLAGSVATPARAQETKGGNGGASDGTGNQYPIAGGAGGSYGTSGGSGTSPGTGLYDGVGGGGGGVGAAGGNGGAGGNNAQFPGGTGGAAGAAGQAGSPGQTVTSSIPDSGGYSAGGGGGGGGGTALTTSGAVVVSIDQIGGAGGAGGNSVYGGGGGGGAGGYGLYLSGSANVTVNAGVNVRGGAGGNGGSTNTFSQGGQGGGGGVGVFGSGVLINAGNIATGAGGISGTSPFTTNAATPGFSAVVGSNLAVTNTGTITGNPGADAITYTGGANALTLSSGGTQGTLIGNIGITGSLAINPGTTSGASATLANVIHDGAGGAGSITKVGAGTLILAGANTYSGTTTVSAGVLQGSTASFSPNSAIFNNATLAFVQPGSGTYARAVTGAGTIAVSGLTTGNTLTFGGNNAVSGFTISDASRVSFTGTNTVTSFFGVRTTGTLGMIDVASGGAITAAGGNTVYASGALTLSNAGLIRSTTEVGVTQNGAVGAPLILTNASTGTISGVYGVYANGVGSTVDNSGSITGTERYGLAFNNGASVTNRLGGTITGGNDALYAYAINISNGSNNLIDNFGTITGGAAGAIQMFTSGSNSRLNLNAGSTTTGKVQVGLGSVTTTIGGALNGTFEGTASTGTDFLSVVAGGSITSSGTAIDTARPLTLTNVSAIVGGTTAITTAGPGATTITNSVGGTIGTGTLSGATYVAGGSDNAISIANSASSRIDNSGKINGAVAGIAQTVGATGSFTLVNRNGGTISGTANDGITARGAGTIVNAVGGTISSATNSGIAVVGATTVTNGGTLTGGNSGQYGYGFQSSSTGAVTFNNYGTSGGSQGGVIGLGSGAMAINLFAGSTTGKIVTGSGNDTLALYNGVTTAAAVTVADPILGGANTVMVRAVGTNLAAAQVGTVDLGTGANVVQLRGSGDGAAAGAAGSFSLTSGANLGSLTKLDTGTWTITGNAAASALTQINAGTGTAAGLLIFNNASNLNSAINVNGATIRSTMAGGFGTGTITTIDPTVQYGATGSYGNAIVLASANPVGDPTILQTFGTGITATLTGLISQSGAPAQPLVFSSVDATNTPNTGTFILTDGGNNYAGLTTISTGTTVVERNTGTALGSGGVTVASGGVLQFDSTGARYAIEGGTYTGGGTLRFTSTSTPNGFDLGNAGNVTFSLASGGLIDVVSGFVAGSASGQGSWTGNLGDMTIAAGATFDTVEGTVQVDALNGAGTLQGGFGGARTFTAGVDNGSGLFSGTIQNSPVSGGAPRILAFAKAGTGTQTLTGVNTYTGATTISGGTLALTNAGSITQSASVTNNANFDISAASGARTVNQLTGTGTVTLGANTLTANNGTPGTISGVISGSGGLTKSGGGILRLTGANIYTGTTNVTAGVLSLGDGGATGSLAGAVVLSNNTQLQFNRTGTPTFANAVSGTGSVRLLNSATVAAAITASSGVIVDPGVTLNVGVDALTTGSIITSGNAVAPGAGSTINVRTASLIRSNGGGSAISNVTGALTIDNAGTIDATNSNTIQTPSAVVTLTNSGTISTTNFVAALLGAGSTATNSGMINGGTNATYGIGVEFNIGGTLTNQTGGTISGPGHAGVQFDGVGILFNGASGNTPMQNASAVITGNTGVIGATMLALTNYGRVTGTNAFQSGINVSGAGSVLNNYGTVEGGAQAIVLNAGGTVYNYGASSVLRTTNSTDDLSDASAIYANGDLTLTNEGMITAVGISGTSHGVEVLGASTITNSGTIDSANAAGIFLFGVGMVTNSGTISGGGTGAFLAGGGTLTNSGTLTADIFGGAELGGTSFTSTLTNSSGGLIQGTNTDSGYGLLVDHGSWAIGNAATATITGGQTGILSRFDAGLVTDNSGLIEGKAQYGILATGTGAAYNAATSSGFVDGLGNAYTAVIVNRAGGQIVGAYTGIETRGSASIANSGTIGSGTVAGGNYTASGQDGIRLLAGGVVTNNANALIQGVGGAGVYVEAVSGTITNSGTIQAANGVFTFGGNGQDLSVTNTNGGLIYATNGTGVYQGGPGALTVTNNTGGTIVATNGDAVHDNGAGLTTLVNDGVLVGNLSGLSVNGAIDITNTGLIGAGTLANGTSGAFTADGQYVGIGTNTGGIVRNNGGTIQGGGAAGITANGALTVTNTGTIATAATGSYNGITASNGALTLTNTGVRNGMGVLTGGIISAATASGIAFTGAGSSITNSGSITGGSDASLGYGVQAAAGSGGVITNQALGLITGGAGGIVRNSAGAVAINNSGVISGTATTSYGINVNAGSGTITNNSGGFIVGRTSGIQSTVVATVFNAGTIAAGTLAGTTVTPGGNTGIQLTAGGSVTNMSGGQIIGGNLYGIGSSVGGVTVDNSGTITTVMGVAPSNITNRTGIYVAGNTGGTSTITNRNGGVISANNFGILVNTTNGTSTILNELGGQITSGNDGIRTFNSATVTNYGSITSGAFAVILYNLPGTVDNYGSIQSGSGGNAISLGKGGTATNHVGGVLTATGAADAWGLYSIGGAATLTNDGTINAGSGIVSAFNGTIVNNAGTITAQTYGVWGLGTTATLTNSGKIAGTIGVQLDTGGTVTNNIAGLIVGQTGGVFASTGSITNSGTIGVGAITNGAFVRGSSSGSGIGAGISFTTGGTVTNNAGASIIGSSNTVFGIGSVQAGIRGNGGLLTVDNSGVITGGVWGVTANGGGSLSAINRAGGVITGTTNNAIFAGSGANSTITNAGTLTGGNAGVYGDGTGLVIMNTGTIREIGAPNPAFNSVSSGIYVSNTGAQITNNGLIESTLAGGRGIRLDKGGTVTNGGTINASTGIIAIGAATTIINTGTISGTAAAINFSGAFADTVTLGTASTTTGGILLGDGADTLNLTTGAVVTGTIDGGAAVDAFIVNGTGSTTLVGNVVNFESLTKNGTGTLTLGGTNGTFGTVTINAGTLNVSGGAAIADGDAVVVNAGGTFGLNTSETIASLSGAGNVSLGGATLTFGGNNSSTTFSGVASGTGGLTKLGTGVFTISGANSYSGTTDVAAGTLRFGANDVLSDLTQLIVRGGATLDLNSFSDTVASFDLQAGGTLTGGGTLTANSILLNGGTLGMAINAPTVTQVSGTTMLSGAVAGNVITAINLNITGGTLQLGGSEQIADTTALTIGTNGIFDLQAFDETVASVISSGIINGTGTLSAATYELQGGTVNANLGAGALTQTSGASLLNGTSGAATVSLTGGTLTLGAANRLADNAALTIASGATLNLAAFSDTVGTATLAGTLAGNGTLTAANYSLTGGTVNANLGAGTLNQNSGSSTLNGTAAAAVVNINAGTLTLGASNRLADNAALAIASGATLDLTTFSDTVGTATLAGTLAGTGTLTAASYALNGATVDGSLGAGALSNVGGVSLLTGTSAAATVAVAGGTLRLGAAERLSNAAVLNIDANGVLDLAGFQETVASAAIAGTLNGTGMLTATTYALNGATVNGNLGAGSLSNVSGVSVLNGISAAGTVSVSGGTLRLGAAERLADTAVLNIDANGVLDLAGFQETVGSASIAGMLSGTGTLTAASYVLAGATINGNLGAGALTSTGTTALNGTSGAGTIGVTSGTLSLGSSNRLADSAAVTIASGATFNLNAFNDTVGSLALNGTLAGTGALSAATYALNGATVNGNLGAGALTSTGTTALNGTASAATVAVNGGTLSLGSSNRLADTAAVAIATGATLNLGAFTDTVSSVALNGTLAGTGTLSAATYTLSGATVNANLGSGALTQSAGTSILSGTSAAATVAVTGGTLRLGANERLLDTAAVSVAAGATFDLAGFTETVATVSGTGTLALGAGRLAIGATNANVTYSGAITGSGDLDKNGTGTLTLAGNYAATGRFNLNGGTTLFTGTTAGSIRVQGATLRGTGTAGGNLLLSSGTLAPGVAAGSIGTLAAASLTVTGGTFAVDFGGTANAFAADLLRVSGAAVLSGGTVSVNALEAPSGYRTSQTYTIVQAGSLSGTFANGAAFSQVNANSAELYWRLRYDLVPSAVVLEVRKVVDFTQTLGTGATANEIAVAGGLNGGAMNASDNWAAILNNIGQQTVAQRLATLDSIGGESNADVTSSVAGVSDVFTDILRQRLSFGSGESGDTSLVTGLLDKRGAMENLRANGAISPQASSLAGTGEKRGGAWIQGIASNSRLDGNRGQASLNNFYSGVAAGVDGRIGVLTIGAAVATTHIESTIAQRTSKNEGTLHQAGGYLAYDNGRSYASVIGSYFEGDIDTERQVLLGGAFAGRAIGNADTTGYTIGGQIGHRFKLDDTMRFAVQASGGKTQVTRQAFTETGAGALSLSVGREQRNLYTAQVEGRLSTLIKAGKNGGTIEPYAGAGVRFNFGDLATLSANRFTGAPASLTGGGSGAFVINGARLSDTANLFSGGVEIHPNDTTTFGIGVDTTLANREREGRISANMRIRF